MDASLSKRTPNSNVRTFIAIELPDQLRQQMAAIRRSFSGREHTLKWVAPAAMHITVKFLGDIARTRIDDVQAGMIQAASTVPPFSLQVSGFGCFPNPRTPRVLWAGISDGDGKRALCALFERIEGALASRGFSRDERSFSPHITLARTRDTISTAERRAVGEMFEQAQRVHDVSASLDVLHVTLMQSELSRIGPVYTPLARVLLEEGAEAGVGPELRPRRSTT
jgi:RNA 2',3'-cyclic 3'-phosphodiesterase